jgi:hypothetical protein
LRKGIVMSKKMSDRKFYKTVLKVVVLSEQPLEWDNLSDVDYAITSGDCSGEITDDKTTTLNAKQVVKELIKQGSDSEFFQLDSDGQDID